MEVIDQYEKHFVYEIDWESNNWQEELREIEKHK